MKIGMFGELRLCADCCSGRTRLTSCDFGTCRPTRRVVSARLTEGLSWPFTLDEGCGGSIPSSVYYETLKEQSSF